MAAADSTNERNGDAFASLRIPEYRILWYSGLFAFMSMQGQFMLRGLLAWDLTGREGALGAVFFVFGVSLLVATPFGGAITDRFPKRTLLIGCHVVILAMATFMAVAVLTDVVAFWMVLFFAVMQGLVFSVYGPTRVAASAEIVGRDALGNAISLSLLSMNGSRVIAPALAGFLAGLPLIGIGGAYVVSAVISLVALAQVIRLPHHSPANDNPGSAVSEIAEGVRFVISQPRLARVVVLMFIVVMFGFSYVAFVPALIEGVFGLSEVWVGLLSSATAIGATAAAIPIARIAGRPGSHRIMVVSGVGFGLGVVLLGVAPTVWVALLFALALGASTTSFQSLSNTIGLASTPDNMQGRVQSLMQLSFAGFGLAAAPLGLLAEAIGLRTTLVIMGGVAAGAAVLYGLAEWPSFDAERARSAGDQPATTAATPTDTANKPAS